MEAVSYERGTPVSQALPALTADEAGVLAALAGPEALRALDVARSLGVARAEANRLLYALEKAGLVRRSAPGASAPGGVGTPLWVLG